MKEPKSLSQKDRNTIISIIDILEQQIKLLYQLVGKSEKDILQYKQEISKLENQIQRCYADLD